MRERNDRSRFARGAVAIVGVIATAAFVLAGTACARTPRLAIERTNASYSIGEVEQRARTVDLGSVARTEAADAPERRRAALVGLRATDEDGRRVADLLTKDFPADTRSVPVLVEAAQVAGRDAWIVVEAYATEGERLSGRRLWVFDRTDGAIITSSAFR